MKAITLGDSGVKLSEIDAPSPKSNQVLVKVHACGMNRSDLLETQGQSFGHLGGDTKVLGGEFAGEVVLVLVAAQGAESWCSRETTMCQRRSFSFPRGSASQLGSC